SGRVCAHPRGHLMEQLEREVLEDLIALLQPERCKDLETLFTQVLTLFQSHGDDWLVLGSENGDPAFYDKLSRRCYEQAYPLLTQHQAALSEPEQRMLYSFVSQGSGGILRDWVKGGMQESASQVVAFLANATKLLIHGLASETNRSR
ncbi:MAG: TetR family transcriptional regulator C-terminal domain-containing protein, partial [Clostridiales bacterium]|nr:TetR family transcriptional regulator C-terminal domain-containing protein [Clostridiales bacterium]